MTEARLTARRTAPLGAVRLTVPPDPSMSRVARLAASGLASLAGCTVDEIEDIKIAVSEVLIALIEHGGGDLVDLEFQLVEPRRDASDGALPDSAAFVVRGASSVSSLDLDDPDLTLCRTVLEGVCATHRLDHVDGVARISASVAKADIG